MGCRQKIIKIGMEVFELLIVLEIGFMVDCGVLEFEEGGWEEKSDDQESSDKSENKSHKDVVLKIIK